MRLSKIYLFILLIATIVFSLIFNNGSYEGLRSKRKGGKKSKRNQKKSKEDNDMYILKTQIVPPVCPVCPNITSSSASSPSTCPPCPPCERCPEPSFDCKKIPSYSSSNSSLPRPILSDFSQFGA